MTKDLTLKMTVEKAPEHVYRAINDVGSWWSGQVKGATDRLGGEFAYRYGTMHYSRQKVVELEPGRRIVWRVEEADLTFVAARSEWKGTQIVFDLAPKGRGTEISFTHVGLGPTLECYDGCASGWQALILTNLRNRILTGAAQPDLFAE
ncbi:MAG TPA: SRPBCC domain-containing protein [Candidatus Thermoplasmatota archaeon]|nr:SRPBCC domain-containing protein [Candidatus Thermoplasmatota archaeon]